MIVVIVISSAIIILLVLFCSSNIQESVNRNIKILGEYKEEIIDAIKKVEIPKDNPIKFAPNELCGHPTIFPDSLESEHLKINDKLYLLEYSSASSKLIDLENRRYWVSEEEDLDLPEEWEKFIEHNVWLTL